MTHVVNRDHDVEELLDPDGTQGGQNSSTWAAGHDRERNPPVMRTGHRDDMLERLQQVHGRQESLMALPADLLDEILVPFREGGLHEGLGAVAAPGHEPLVRHLEPMPTEDLEPAGSIHPHGVDKGAVAVEEQRLGLGRGFERCHTRHRPTPGTTVESPVSHDEPMKKPLRVLASTTAVAAALTIGGMSTAHADDYMFLKAQELQQTVLRVQLPKTLGPWTQNYYYTETGSSFTVPTMCWDGKGAVTLPKAKVMGAVGYAVNTFTSGSVTIYQYADAQAAQAALDAMQQARCSDNPRVANEGGQLVPAQSGSDFTDQTMTGYAAGVSYSEGDVQAFQDIRTTQRGLAIVQTELYRAVESSRSMADQQQVANRLSSVNRSWHANVVRAYESFGQGRAR